MYKRTIFELHRNVTHITDEIKRPGLWPAFSPSFQILRSCSIKSTSMGSKQYISVDIYCSFTHNMSIHSITPAFSTHSIHFSIQMQYFASVSICSIHQYQIYMHITGPIICQFTYQSVCSTFLSLCSIIWNTATVLLNTSQLPEISRKAVQCLGAVLWISTLAMQFF